MQNDALQTGAPSFLENFSKTARFHRVPARQDGERRARGTSTSGATNAVHVILQRYQNGKLLRERLPKIARDGRCMYVYVRVWGVDQAPMLHAADLRERKVICVCVYMGGGGSSSGITHC